MPLFTIRGAVLLIEPVNAESRILHYRKLPTGTHRLPTGALLAVEKDNKRELFMLGGDELLLPTGVIGDVGNAVESLYPAARSLLFDET